MSRRKPVTVTVPEDVIVAARNLALNTSQAAEAGIREAIRDALAAKWRSENAEAIPAYNRQVEQRGVAIPALWGVAHGPV